MNNLLKLYQQYRLIIVCCLLIPAWFLILFLVSLTKGYLSLKDRELRKDALLASYNSNKNIWPHQQFKNSKKVLAKPSFKKQNTQSVSQDNKENTFKSILNYIECISNEFDANNHQKQLFNIFQNVRITSQFEQKSILIEIPYFTSQSDE